MLAALLEQSPMLGARTAHISPADWRRAVGDRLAERTMPERISEGVLSVRVPSSTWAQELSLLSHVVLERLQAAGHPVQRMRFHVHAQSHPAQAREVTTVRRVDLPAPLQQSLAQLDDPELRLAIAEAAAYSLARRPG